MDSNSRNERNIGVGKEPYKTNLNHLFKFGSELICVTAELVVLNSSDVVERC